MTLSKLQLMSFEVTPLCNLAHCHKFCPSAIMDRSGDPATNEQFISFLTAAIAAGFVGNVAFHYCNEPTLNLCRCMQLHSEVKRLGLSTTLWTNGTTGGDLSTFDNVYITSYPEARKDCATKPIPYQPDDRINIYTQEPTQQYRPCYRPECIEMPIDYNGNVHLCCGDWARQINLGNIITHTAGEIFTMWEIAIEKAKSGEYDVCRRCQGLVSSPAMLESGYIV